VVEISYSSRSYDLGPKLALYQRAGVSEYVVVLLEEQRIEWRILEDGSYRKLAPGAGIFKSVRFPCLWLKEAAYWHNDSERMLATLEEGLRSEEERIKTLLPR
jgi:hypothetical protein